MIRTVLIHHPRAEAYAGLTAARFPGLRLLCSAPGEAVPAEHWAVADVLLTSNLPLPAIPAAPQLRFIQLTSAGVESLLPWRERLAMAAVANARGVSGTLISEYVMMVAAMLHWDMPGVLRNQAARRWQSRNVKPLAGRVLGIVGVGTIGTEIAVRARSAGLVVYGVKRDPSVGAENLDRVFGPDELSAFLPLCDTVVLVLPATAATRGLIGRRELALMKPDAVLVNVARGDVVDEAALAEALAAGRLKGAALDVFAEEPLPGSHPFWDMPNVIVTPHMAGAVIDYVERVFAIFADNLQRLAAGQPLRNGVDLARGY